MVDIEGLSIDEVIEHIKNLNSDVIIWVDPFVGRNHSVIWTPNWMDVVTGESDMLDPQDSISDAFVALYKYFDDKQSEDQLWPDFDE